MNYIIFHIPHSSLKIPKKYWNICLKDKSYIEKTNIFLSDYLTDKLIPNKSHKLIFKYSRLFCDVEKFINDKKEIMAKIGMGVIYTHDCDNKIAIPNKRYKKKIIKSYYKKHHNKLDKIVTTALHKYQNCLIIDFHSFSDEMVKKLFNINDTPDICIGTDEFYTNKKLLNFTIEYFKKNGYSVYINNPYAGTIIPNKYLNKKEEKISSIMLEINKKLYLNNNFHTMKNCIENYIEKISTYDIST